MKPGRPTSILDSWAACWPFAACAGPARASGLTSRANGAFTLAMRAVGTARFPCGNLPRLLLSGVIGDKAVFWRDYDCLIPSEIRLSQPFFDSTVRQPVPIIINCLHALRRSTRGLDRYFRLTCRAFSLTAPLALTWAHVYTSMAPSLKRPAITSPSGTIAKKCLGELKKIKLAWPAPNDYTELWGVILHPTPPPIPDERGPDTCA